jgi:hypothetical protein
MAYWTKVAITLTVVGMMGCSGGPKGEPTADINGVVKRNNGEPVADVVVVFYPDKGQTGQTKTDSTGKFKVTVPVGMNKIAIVSEASVASGTGSSPEEAKKISETKVKVDRKYANPLSSALEVTVKAGKNDPLELKIE